MKNQNLFKVEDSSLYDKIKKFFKKIFKRKQTIYEKQTNQEVNTICKKDKFIEYITKIENEETELLKLQKQYRSGEIKEEELTEKQKSDLCKLFDRQIESLKKSNESRLQKLLKNNS